MVSISDVAKLKPISSDSHVVEPPSAYTDRIDPKFRDRAPFLAYEEKRGDVYNIPGLAGGKFTIGSIAAAGTPPELRRWDGKRFEELHRGGWEPKARIVDMDRDKVAAELLYPTIGMTLIGHPDFEYARACMQAYNGWLEEFCSAAPERLYGIGMTAARNPKEMIADLEQFKDMGFKGVMLPDAPGEEDYDHEIYDPVWQACVDLDLPPSFHVLPMTRASAAKGAHISVAPENKPRGGRLNAFLNVIRLNQDVIGLMIFGGVFDRVPDLKLVCVEADAGWAPHYMYRMDHMYKEHRFWAEAKRIQRMPSEYFRENVYMTFQDDLVAFQTAELNNPSRLLWASDFPHTDSTWPHSMESLEMMTAHVDAATAKRIVHDNVNELYKLNIQ